MNHHDDEMLDDLHQGVEALRIMAHAQSIPLSERAVITLNRLENSVPATRTELRLWRRRFKDGAAKAAQKTDEAIHEHPWPFFIGALGLGILAGLALTRSEEEV